MPDIPYKTRVIAIQARTSDDVYYRFRGQTTYWTVKADSFHSIVGEFNQGELQLNAATGVVVELQYSTQRAIGAGSES
jgi:hypothetical protein